MNYLLRFLIYKTFFISFVFCCGRTILCWINFLVLKFKWQKEVLNATSSKMRFHLIPSFPVSQKTLDISSHEFSQMIISLLLSFLCFLHFCFLNIWSVTNSPTQSQTLSLNGWQTRTLHIQFQWNSTTKKNVAWIDIKQMFFPTVIAI